MRAMSVFQPLRDVEARQIPTANDSPEPQD